MKPDTFAVCQAVKLCHSAGCPTSNLLRLRCVPLY